MRCVLYGFVFVRAILLNRLKKGREKKDDNANSPSRSHAIVRKTELEKNDFASGIDTAVLHALYHDDSEEVEKYIVKKGERERERWIESKNQIATFFF